MSAVPEKAWRLLLSNDSWLFATLILFISYVMMIEAEQYSWGLYLGYSLSAGLLYTPVLLFIAYRPLLKKRWRPLLYSGVWACCFLAYPFLLALGRSYLFPALPFMPALYETSTQQAIKIIAGTGIAMAALEIALALHGLIRRNTRAGSWLKQESLEKALIATLLLVSVACVAGNNLLEEDTGLQKSTTVLQFISYTLQFFLASLSYYAFYYINHYLLINKLLRQKGFFYYLFGLAATILAFYPLLGQLMSFLPIFSGPGAGGPVFHKDPYAIIPILVMLLSFPLILAIEWFKQRSEIAGLEKEKASAELNLLKQQVNPHFFFNTLNNLYALSLSNDRQTPEVIMQLSELMRYVIYKGREEQAPLAEEAKYIEDYIQLQRIRLHKKLDYRFEKDIAVGELSVAPLLFIILVENAFKHGIEPAENDCFLHMQLKSDEHGLLFSCENSFETRKPAGNGIGLANLRRRLALLYPGQHELTLQESGHTFKAMLKLAV
ncbi:MAG: histidine kinase [Phaeodactylibacter sp.]|nr:histidine kinase [Phaeodactylibacter sp.]MCB9276795.1 histidine kinase [Lewinellaceae bacterium]